MDDSLTSVSDEDDLTFNVSNLSVTSNGFVGQHPLPSTPSHLVLRSKCQDDGCPLGRGIQFRSRISPSPSKSRLRTRRRRRSDRANEGWNLPPDETRLEEVSPFHSHSQSNISHHTLVSKMETIPEPTIIPISIAETPKKRKETRKPLRSDRKSRESSDTSGYKSNSSRLTSESHFVEQISQPTNSAGTFNASVDSESFVAGEKFFNDFRERQTSDYFSSSDTPQKLKESTRRLTLHKTSSPYIAYSSDDELADWWNSPKTDYTYSTSPSYRKRVSPERRVGSPNMSRKSLRGLSGQMLTSSPFSTTYSSSVADESLDNLRLRTRNVNRLHAFSDTSEEDEVDRSVRRSTRSSVSKSNISDRRFQNSRTSTQSSITRKSLFYGLDNDNPEMAQPDFITATPLVRSSNKVNPLITQSNSYQTTYNSNQNYEYLNQSGRIGDGLHSDEELSWKNKLSQWSKNSYTNVRQLFSYILTFLTTVFTIVKMSEYLSLSRLYKKSLNFGRNIWLRFNEAKSNVGARTFNSVGRMFTRTTTIVTTVVTTVVTSVQTGVVQSAANATVWYKEKRRARPVLWMWLPLLIGIILLAPLIGLLMREDSEDQVTMNPYVRFYGSPSKLFDSENSFFSFIQKSSESVVDMFDSGCSSVFYGLSSFCNMISDIIGYVFSLITWLFGLLYDICQFFWLWLFSSSTSGGEDSYLPRPESHVFANMFDSAASAVSNAISQSSTLFGSFSSACISSLTTLWNWLLSFVVLIVCFFKTLGIYAFEGLATLLYWFSSLILSMFGGIGFYAGQSMEQVLVFFSMLGSAISSLILSIFGGIGFYAGQSMEQVVVFFSMLSSVVFANRSRANVYTENIIVKETVAQPAFSIDENMLKNLINVQLEKSVLMLVDENVKKNVLSRDEVSVLVRQGVEAEMTLLRTQSESSAKELNSKIVNLEGYHQYLLKRLDELGRSVSSFDLTREEYAEKQMLFEMSMNNITNSIKNLENKYTDLKIDLLNNAQSAHECPENCCQQEPVIGIGTSQFIYNGLNESQVSRIVHDALLKFDADKTGMVDHALESSGGSVVSTRCTEGFQGHQAELTVMGFSIYRYSTNTPRSIIQPDRMPGQCFAFKGSQGYIVIQLSGPVKMSGFTLDHIPASLSPSGAIDSAPKEFSVHGLRSPEDPESFHFGNYMYDKAGEPLQYFAVTNFTDEYFPYVELKINTNYGHIQYTCIYRFRVHGMRLL